jgi:hypothetical protein
VDWPADTQRAAEFVSELGVDFLRVGVSVLDDFCLFFDFVARYKLHRICHRSVVLVHRPLSFTTATQKKKNEGRRGGEGCGTKNVGFNFFFFCFFF